MARSSGMARPAGGSPAEIISASRRTDVPAFHARWFLNRLRERFCHWVHPYTGRVRRVSLHPERVIAIVFWTRDPGPLLDSVEALRREGYPLLFQFTLNGYGPPLEPYGPRLGRALARFERLARLLGPEALVWRYDPILLSRTMSPAWHVRRFRRLAASLKGLTQRCTVSFVDLYGKTRRNLARAARRAGGREYRAPELPERRALARDLAGVAAGRGIRLAACCEEAVVGGPVERARCVDPLAVAAVRGGAPPELPSRPTRRGCRCVRSVDVGAYDTCAFGCAYCYAVSSREAARERLRAADPQDTLLWRPPRLRGADLEALEKEGCQGGSEGGY